jgi:hypothetical protein
MSSPSYLPEPGVPPNVWLNAIIGNTSGSAPSNSIGQDGNYFLDADSGKVFGPKASGNWPAGERIVPAGNFIMGNTGGSTPNDSIGDNGNFFIDVSTGKVWGPKASGTWSGTYNTNIQGAANTIFGNSGGSPPSNSLGDNGDWFFDVSTSTWYGPMASGVWPGTAHAVAGGVNTIFGNSGGVPSNSLGIVGDYFYDTANQNFYGPKGGGGWPTSPQNVAAINPANAILGNSSGAAPDNSIGVNGDYYIDTSAGYYYGPKSGGAWPGTGHILIPAATNPYNLIVGSSSSGGAPSDALYSNGDYFLDTFDGSVYGPKASGHWPATPVYSPASAPANVIMGVSGSPPSNTIGENGDYFIRPGQGDIFGPKAAGAWPATPVNNFLSSPAIATGSDCPLGSLVQATLSGAAYWGSNDPKVITSIGVGGTLCIFSNGASISATPGLPASAIAAGAWVVGQQWMHLGPTGATAISGYLMQRVG